MKRYDIFLCDRCYSVFSSSDGGFEGKECRDGVSIYISPAAVCDCSVSVGKDPSWDAEPWEIALVLAYFFRRIRGYPKTELSVELSGRAVALPILDTPPGYSACCLPKCNSFYTNSVVFPDGTQRNLYTAHIGGGCRILPVESPSGFDPAVLLWLLVIDGIPDVRHAIACSERELILGENDRLTPCLIGAVATVFGTGAFSFRGQSYPVIESRDCLTALFPCCHFEVNI